MFLRAAMLRKVSSLEYGCLLLVMFLCLAQSVTANRRRIADTNDESIEEGHVNPGGYTARNRPGKSLWWPATVSVSTQAFLRQTKVPRSLAQLSSMPATSTAKRASHHPSETEHSNPQIPTTGVRAPRGAHEYDVPQIECPNAEDGMERFACPTPDSLGRYRCIEDHVLCDGFLDCPDGSDEDRHSCMFYKTTKAHLDVLADALLRWARGRYN